MSAPLPDSLLRDYIYTEAHRVDQELNQPDGTALGELYPRPLIEATRDELMMLWHQLQDTNFNGLGRFLRGQE